MERYKKNPPPDKSINKEPEQEPNTSPSIWPASTRYTG